MDTTTLIIIVVVVLVVLFIMNRSRGGYGGSNYGNRGGVGPERPTYDDPDYTSSGSIGGAEPRSYPSQERSVGGGDAPAQPRNDDPNYRSGGSIGGA